MSEEIEGLEAPVKPKKKKKKKRKTKIVFVDKATGEVHPPTDDR